MNRNCRRELRERIEIPRGDEMRLGVWMPSEGNRIYERLQGA
mgnify:FL=1|jgi:hypothetical protein